MSQEPLDGLDLALDPPLALTLDEALDLTLDSPLALALDPSFQLAFHPSFQLALDPALLAAGFPNPPAERRLFRDLYGHHIGEPPEQSVDPLSLIF